MTLADFAVLVNAGPKWVLNTRAVLGAGVRYSVAVAERLALARILNVELGIPLPRGWEMAGVALAETVASPKGFEFVTAEGTLTVIVDVHRLRAAIATRRSQIAIMPPRHRAGRKPKRPSNALAAARRYGIDVTLLQANLMRRPVERIRQLDGMVAFSQNVQRKT